MSRAPPRPSRSARRRVSPPHPERSLTIPPPRSPAPPDPPRRLAAVATRARVQADAVQRLRHAVPPDEHARPLDARAPRGRGGRAQEEVAPGIALVLESGEEAVRGRGAGRPVRQGRDRRSGVGQPGDAARATIRLDPAEGFEACAFVFFSSRVRRGIIFRRGGGAAARATEAHRGRRPPPPRRTRGGTPPRARDGYTIELTIII